MTFVTLSYLIADSGTLFLINPCSNNDEYLLILSLPHFVTAAISGNISSCLVDTIGIPLAVVERLLLHDHDQVSRALIEIMLLLLLLLTRQPP